MHYYRLFMSIHSLLSHSKKKLKRKSNQKQSQKRLFRAEIRHVSLEIIKENKLTELLEKWDVFNGMTHNSFFQYSYI